MVTPREWPKNWYKCRFVVMLFSMHSSEVALAHWEWVLLAFFFSAGCQYGTWWSKPLCPWLLPNFFCRFSFPILLHSAHWLFASHILFSFLSFLFFALFLFCFTPFLNVFSCSVTYFMVELLKFPVNALLYRVQCTQHKQTIWSQSTPQPNSLWISFSVAVYT